MCHGIYEVSINRLDVILFLYAKLFISICEEFERGTVTWPDSIYQIL